LISAGAAAAHLMPANPDVDLSTDTTDHLICDIELL
jgi:hypothetical protein